MMRKWTVQESEIMRKFIRENPTVKLSTIRLPSSLSENLPGRTIEAVYHCWRRMLGLKRKKRPAMLSLQKKECDVSVGFLWSLDLFIAQYVERQVSEKVGALKTENERLAGELAELQEENEELKKERRKLTRVREAVESYQSDRT
jgi:cell division protein FtsB